MLNKDSASATEGSLGSRPTVANYLTDVSYEVVTRDMQDHTFHGIMFDIRAKADLPVEVVHVEEIWVRGSLGPMKVWWAVGGFQPVRTQPEAWTEVYDGFHPANFEQLTKLELQTPIPLRAGQLIGVYIHSSAWYDTSLVYDNRRAYVVHEDLFVRVLPGMAHMDHRPFGNQNPWRQFGFQGAFRANRTFVGRLKMGAKFMLWNPETHRHFPRRFRDMVLVLLLCARRPECWLNRFSTEVLFWMINMCRWDWPPDATKGVPMLSEYARRRPPNRTLYRWRRHRMQHEDESCMSEELSDELSDTSSSSSWEEEQPRRQMMMISR
eukprot:gnl/TRDRNA2_/TRDRNA2_168567_c0_seq2.p1 gnl/TRDRNA2_/TRDRNA2_168567_c0~~gnl/TRDRNA2_/TRDRNA2_168567_c0_seq2.p1  ORF type:complete len:323 (-),score=36.89 gnl/TRDRNA2_/TRDRNA2_168567_c0_seq2:110-1078(-)